MTVRQYVRQVKSKVDKNVKKVVDEYAIKIWTTAVLNAPKEAGNLQSGIEYQIEVNKDLHAIYIISKVAYSLIQHEEDLRHLPDIANTKIHQHKMLRAAESLGYTYTGTGGYYDKYSAAYSWLKRHNLWNSISKKYNIPFLDKAYQEHKKDFLNDIQNAITKAFD